MPGEDAGGAVELFQQHRAGKQMRPRGAAEGEQQVRFGALGLGMPVGRADRQAAFADALVAPAPELGCKFFGGEVAALFVEQYGARGAERIG